MATNRPDTLDPALMRPGRLDRKVEFSLPDLDGRTNIFKIHARSMSVEKDIRYLITKIYLYMILNWGLSNHNLCSLPRVGFSCRRARSGLPKMGLLADLISHITYLQRTGPSKAQGGGSCLIILLTVGFLKLGRGDFWKNQKGIQGHKTQVSLVVLAFQIYVNKQFEWFAWNKS